MNDSQICDLLPGHFDTFISISHLIFRYLILFDVPFICGRPYTDSLFILWLTSLLFIHSINGGGISTIYHLKALPDLSGHLLMRLLIHSGVGGDLITPYSFVTWLTSIRLTLSHSFSHSIQTSLLGTSFCSFSLLDTFTVPRLGGLVLSWCLPLICIY